MAKSFTRVSARTQLFFFFLFYRRAALACHQCQSRDLARLIAWRVWITLVVANRVYLHSFIFFFLIFFYFFFLLYFNCGWKVMKGVGLVRLKSAEDLLPFSLSLALEKSGSINARLTARVLRLILTTILNSFIALTLLIQHNWILIKLIFKLFN